MSDIQDQNFMRAALAVARRGQGRVAPNPPVGCVIVKNGVVVGRGWTADGGRPHAETQALAQAGAQARGADVYVTLEPCAHHGQTPPCVNALIAADVGRVITAMQDPDPRVAGQGHLLLQAAHIPLVTGVLEVESRQMIDGFASRIHLNRPHVSLKLAVSADGKISSKKGRQLWITGDLARRHVHLLRSHYDAILTGIGTILSDNPLMTTRLPGYEHRARRIVLDTQLSMPEDARILDDTDHAPVLIVHAPMSGPEKKKKALLARGAELIEADTRDLPALLGILAARGVTRLLVEAGQGVSTAFVKAGAFDDFFIYRAPSVVLGPGALDALDGYDINLLCQGPGLIKQKTRVLGQDLLEIYVRPA